MLLIDIDELIVKLKDELIVTLKVISICTIYPIFDTYGIEKKVFV